MAGSAVGLVRRAGPGPARTAAAVGLFLALLLVILCATAWLGPLPPEPPERAARRSSFADLWPDVAPGQTLSAVIDRLGPPDETEPTFDRIPACPDACPSPCPGPCTPSGTVPQTPACRDFHTCVQSHSWLSSPAAETSDLYVACTDAQGIVRRVERGSAFRLRFDSHGEGQDVAAFLVGQALLALVAVPFAVALHAWRCWRPWRLPSSLPVRGGRDLP